MRVRGTRTHSATRHTWQDRHEATAAPASRPGKRSLSFVDDFRELSPPADPFALHPHETPRLPKRPSCSRPPNAPRRAYAPAVTSAAVRGLRVSHDEVVTAAEALLARRILHRRSETQPAPP